MRYLNKIYTLVAIFFVCFTVHSNAKSDNIKPSKSYDYGVFCGAGKPSLQGISDREHAREHLSKIEPLDFIDAACKGHDICYTYKGRFSDKCDDYLGLIISTAIYSNPECKKVVNTITSFFKISPNFGNNQQWRNIVNNYRKIRGQSELNYDNPDPKTEDYLNDISGNLLGGLIGMSALVLQGDLPSFSTALTNYTCNPLNGRDFRYINAYSLQNQQIKDSYKDAIQMMK